ncbi:OLC1v1032983C1 [Oldenlandia corymbosa var. corymbosa]|uniref:OLC1v1032983C1 n=1 Tax=Oldenlandia corymbosa var. corymbosa TaxID=529605 RepID=A0AAV1CN81_OLDCO|nr:OLC1v1032983C1 [Oldenlandia corymbosa var. corymbosa]
MSLARLVLRNLQQKSALASSSSVFNSAQKQRLGTTTTSTTATSSGFRRWFSSAAAGEETPAVKEVAVSDRDSNKKFKLFPRSSSKRGRSLWRRDPLDFPPALSGLGNALVQATENISKLLGKLSPSGLMGRVRKQDDCYKLQYCVPGLTKDDVKVFVEDGVLIIKGSRVEEEHESDDDADGWSGLNYFGFYDASIMLPDDAKVDEIKAEMKNGVLTIVIPRDERLKKDVKEIRVS